MVSSVLLLGGVSLCVLPWRHDRESRWCLRSVSVLLDVRLGISVCVLSVTDSVSLMAFPLLCLSAPSGGIFDSKYASSAVSTCCFPVRNLHCAHCLQ